MNKLLNVPIVTQENNYDCSIASLSMLLKFHGKIVPYEALVEELKDHVNPSQRHIEAVAIYLAKRQYDVHFANMNKSVLGDVLINKTEQDLIEFEKYFDALADNNNVFKKAKVGLAIEYIKAGGKLDTHQPTIEKIVNLVEQNIPVMICVKAAGIRNNPMLKSNHYVVVSGIQDGQFVLSDSSPHFTKPYLIDIQTIEKAWQSTGYYMLWIQE